MLSIKEVCNKYGFSEVYVRRMISKGKIEVIRKPIKPNSKVIKIFIEEEEFEKFLGNRSRGRRNDGRNKFTVYLLPEEFEKFIEFMNSEDIPSELLQRTNKPKTE